MNPADYFSSHPPRCIAEFVARPTDLPGVQLDGHASMSQRTFQAPADVTIFDLSTEWTYDVQQSFSKSRNSPFHGRTFRGGPLATIVEGEIVWSRFQDQTVR